MDGEHCPRAVDTLQLKESPFLGIILILKHLGGVDLGSSADVGGWLQTTEGVISEFLR